jgi:hypothetical protein
MPGTRQPTAHLWMFSYTYTSSESSIVGQWTLLATEPEIVTVPTAFSKEGELPGRTRCTLEDRVHMRGPSKREIPNAVCQVCVDNPCPQARAGAASWHGGGSALMSDTGHGHGSHLSVSVPVPAFGWIFGGYDRVRGVIFDDLWRLDPYGSGVITLARRPAAADDTADDTDQLSERTYWGWVNEEHDGLFTGRRAGPKPTLSQFQPLWRKMPATSSVLWPQPSASPIQFQSFGQPAETGGALWLLTGYGGTMPWIGANHGIFMPYYATTPVTR